MIGLSVTRICLLWNRWEQGRQDVNIKDVFADIIPFDAIVFLTTAVLIHFPALASWMPRLMFGPP